MERNGNHGDRPSRRSLHASFLLHLLILFGVLLLPWKPLEEIPVTSVTLVLEQSGSAGASGGAGQGAGGGTATGDDATKGMTAAQSTNVAAATSGKPTEPAQPPTVEPAEAAAETAPTMPPPTPDGVLPSRPKVPRPQIKPRPPPPRPVERLVAARPVDRPSASPAAAPNQAQRSASTETRDIAPKGTDPQPAAAASAANAGSPKGVAGAGPGGALGPGQGTAGSGQGTHGPGGDGTGDDYLKRVLSWIRKFKPHPPDGLKQDKATLLLVALARDGTVVDVQVVESSGVQLLDQIALDWVRRASPVPPAPASIPGEPLKFRLPVDFRPAFLDRLF